MNILTRVPAHTKNISTGWKELRKNWLIDVVNKFVILLFVLSVVFLVLKWQYLPPLVPLWFSRAWGTDQLIHPAFLVLLPLASMLWYGVNLVVSIYLTSEYLIFTQMLFLSSLIVSVLSFISLIKILFLVT